MTAKRPQSSMCRLSPALDQLSPPLHGCAKARFAILVAIVLFPSSVLVKVVVDQAGVYVATGHQVSQTETRFLLEDLALVLLQVIVTRQQLEVMAAVIRQAPQHPKKRHPLEPALLRPVLLIPAPRRPAPLNPVRLSPAPSPALPPEPPPAVPVAPVALAVPAAHRRRVPVISPCPCSHPLVLPHLQLQR